MKDADALSSHNNRHEVNRYHHYHDSVTGHGESEALRGLWVCLYSYTQDLIEQVQYSYLTVVAPLQTLVMNEPATPSSVLHLRVCIPRFTRIANCILRQDIVTTTVVVPETDTITADTSTTTITVLVSSSTTLSAGTITIPTSAGFLPVQSTLPGASAKKRSLKGRVEGPTSPRHGTLFARAQTKQICPATNKPLPASWAKSVTCYKLVVAYSVSVISKTASKTATRTLPTSTQTNTVRTDYSVIPI